MLDLELIASELRKTKHLHKQLTETKAPYSVFTQYSGIIQVYKEILKGEYDKRWKENI